MKTTVVVPVWNEDEERLIGVLKDLRGFVNEVVVVDDGSRQHVNKSIKQHINNKVYLLRHKINRGQGAALQTGTDFAVRQGAQLIVHFDGDGQHRGKDIPGLVKPILDGQAEYVFGSKMLGGYRNMPWTKRKIIMPISRIIDRMYTGLKLTDVHSGLRAFSARAADKLYLTQDKMAHATEYPYLVKKYKIKYTEVPVEIVYHKYGRGLGEGFRILKDLLFGKIVKR